MGEFRVYVRGGCRVYCMKGVGAFHAKCTQDFA